MIRQEKGMSLVQTLMAIAISVISIGAIAGILSQTFAVSKELDIQALMDTRHADVLHRAGSLRFIRNHFNLSETGTGSLIQCLRSKGSSCQTLGSTTMSELRDAEGDFNSYYGIKLGKCAAPSSDCVIQQIANYKWICPSAQECTELIIGVETSYVGGKQRKVFKTRSNQLNIPARSLLSRGEIDYSCTNSSVLMGIDYRALKARCAPVSGRTQTNLQMPAASLGADMEAKTEESSCSGGLSQLGLFSSQSQCGVSAASSGPPSASETTQCTMQQLSALNALMVKKLPKSVTQIATNCIDAATPTLNENMPVGVFKTLRFKNTCGNRECTKLGYASGRVIEINNDNAILECRHDAVPPAVSNPCEHLFSGPAAPVISMSVLQRVVQEECIDTANPTVESNNPERSEGAQARFFLVCGSRSCVKRGYHDGRVVESYGGEVSLQCFNDIAETFKEIPSNVTEIAQNCIDAAVPTLAQNLPSAGAAAAERFMMTCGNRYCSKLGYQAGEVKEINGSQVKLRCVQ